MSTHVPGITWFSKISALLCFGRKYSQPFFLILSGGGIVRRNFVRGDFIQGDIVRGISCGGCCPGGYCPGRYCPDTVLIVKLFFYIIIISITVDDANAKMPSGILRGKMTWLGSFDGCLQSTAMRDGAEVFRGRYCQATVPLVSNG